MKTSRKSLAQNTGFDVRHQARRTAGTVFAVVCFLATLIGILVLGVLLIDIIRDGAVATGAQHPLMCDRCSLGTVESRDATRRCRTPPGTASPDAVPQISGRPNPRPAKPLLQFRKQ